jgi:Leucine-rich repeat (LRR) protein
VLENLELLSNLTSLNASRNQLLDVANIQQLVHLVDLDLSHNRL